MIWFCVPLWNRGDNFKKLCQNLIDVPPPFSFKMIVGDFHSDDVDWDDLKSKNFPLEIIQHEGKFNIAIALQSCFDFITDPNDILITCDADIVFENTSVYDDMIKIEKNKTFWCPVVSHEEKAVNFNSRWNGNVHVPTGDHGGTGFVVVYKEDMEECGGFKNSVFMGPRGQKWGQHDDHMTRALKKKIEWIRPIEERIWVRKHPRIGHWFS